jgi:hypothetical protein
MSMMIVPRRNHTYGPPRPVTGPSQYSADANNNVSYLHFPIRLHGVVPKHLLKHRADCTYNQMINER